MVSPEPKMLHIQSTILVCGLLIVHTYSNANINWNQARLKLKPLHQIWKSTGFCPPAPHTNFSNYIELDAVKQNIKMIGNLPYRPNTFQIRVHWLLNLVSMTTEGGFNFTHLDQFINLCSGNGLSMGFELMGNPSNYFSDFEDREQVEKWYQLVYQTAKRYADFHQNWNYESWNEPDHVATFDGLNFTVQGFLNYFDANEKGVHDADHQAIFGGPGASCRLTTFSKLCWAVIDHISNGKNYFTNKTGTRVDFVSVHKKGGDRGKSGNSSVIYNAELETIRQIQSQYQPLTNISFYNDEGDPMKGWDYPVAFNALVHYPAMIVRIIHMHLYSTDPEFRNYKMTSNDNAFLSLAPNYFTQRTLLAALTLRAYDGAPAVLVRKPVYELMAMLVQVQGSVVVFPGQVHNIDAVRGCISTCTDAQLMTTCWASNDTNNYTAGPADYRIILPPRIMGGYYVIRSLNQITTYDIWNSMGSPGNLSRHQLELLWNTTMITSTKPRKVVDQVNLRVSGPGVTQLLVCKQKENLTTPHTLSFHTITKSIVVISWLDDQISDCFLTYELEIRRSRIEAFTTINNGLLLSRVYQYASQYGIAGEYRVRGRNILGQVSSYSPIAKL